MATIYYDSDADPSIIKGKKVPLLDLARICYGMQSSLSPPVRNYLVMELICQVILMLFRQRVF